MVEGWLELGGEERGWIYSNPIYVRLPSRRDTVNDGAARGTVAPWLPSTRESIDGDHDSE
jgi:hypothetical protein